MAISLIMLLVSTVATAEDISRSRFFELFQNTRRTFETVEQGMTAEYKKIYIYPEYECHFNQKEVVLSSNNSLEYLVYTEIIVTQGCPDYQLGEVTKHLTWTKTIEAKSYYLEFEDQIFTRISQYGSIVMISGTIDGSYSSQVIDLGNSQFYNTTSRFYDTTKFTLLRTSFTDVLTINVDGVEVTDDTLED